MVRAKGKQWRNKNEREESGTERKGGNNDEGKRF
jgi:hypothetical protein